MTCAHIYFECIGLSPRSRKSAWSRHSISNLTRLGTEDASWGRRCSAVTMTMRCQKEAVRGGRRGAGLKMQCEA
eukprot:6360989-Alexandrium_andersonii.AAC.1